MPADWWNYLLVAVLATLVLLGVLFAIGMRNDRRSTLGRHARRGPGSAHRAGALEAGSPPPPRKRVAVIVNPTKVDDPAAWRRELVETFARYEWDVPLTLETDADDPGPGQARAALAAGVDLVCVLGGDGTIRHVAQVLAGTSMPLGLLPGGTGNLLALNLHVPGDSLEAAVRVAVAGQDRPVDVGWVVLDAGTRQASRKAFVVMAGMGFDADIMEKTSQELKDTVGWPAYISGGVRGMFQGRFKMTLGVDGGEARTYRTRTIVAGNCGRLVGGITLMPEAQLDDGVLDVLIMSPRGLASWARVAAHVITKRTSALPALERFRARTLDVTVEEPRPVQADGDVLGEATTLRFEIAPKSLIVRTTLAGAAADSAGGEEVGVVDRGDVRMGPQPGLEEVVAEGAGDDVRGIPVHPAGTRGELGREGESRDGGVQPRVEEEGDGQPGLARGR